MKNKSGNIIIQDGVECPVVPPWSKHSSKFTGIPLLLMTVTGIVILFLTSKTALILWLFAFFLFAYPLRYLVCARCPYYSKKCYNPMAKVIPLLFKKQEGKSMVLGLWLDVVFAVILFALPLPFAYQLCGWPLVVIWSLLFFLIFCILTKVGCSVCPFSFCPIGKAGRAFWNFFKFI